MIKNFLYVYLNFLYKLWFTKSFIKKLSFNLEVGYWKQSSWSAKPSISKISNINLWGAQIKSKPFSMTAAKLAYQTRFSIPQQLNTPPITWLTANSLNHLVNQSVNHSGSQKASLVNVPVAKVLSNFDVKADQLRQQYESTLNQVIFPIFWIVLILYSAWKLQ